MVLFLAGFVYLFASVLAIHRDDRLVPTSVFVCSPLLDDARQEDSCLPRREFALRCLAQAVSSEEVMPSAARLRSWTPRLAMQRLLPARGRDAVAEAC